MTRILAFISLGFITVATAVATTNIKLAFALVLTAWATGFASSFTGQMDK